MKVGDRVKYVGDNKHYAEQARGRIGRVTEAPLGTFSNWSKVEWSETEAHAYPTRELQCVEPLMQPEFELDEINMAQEIYSKLEGR